MLGRENIKSGLPYIIIVITVVLAIGAYTWSVSHALYDRILASDTSCEAVTEDIKRLISKSTAIKIKMAADKRLKEILIKIIMDLQPKLDKQTAEKIIYNVLLESLQKDLDPALITSMIFIESGFNPFAESNKGAVGLMQIRYKIWNKTSMLTENGVTTKDNLFWIDANIRVGIGIFHKYYEHAKQDLIKALYRYNTGSTKLPKGKRYYEMEYVNKVIINAYIIRDTIIRNNINRKEGR
jgi:soluble lytic murein transglycosylase